ncbi:MAG: EamA family transporter [Candidatus Bruticola sp.]
MIKVLGLILTGVSVTAVADIFVSKGMRSIDSSVRSLRDIWRIVRSVLTNVYVLAGAGLLTLSFVLWLVMLSMADLSLLLPLTALNYIINAFLAKIYLHEHVSPLRWAGTLIIFCGIVVVVLS